MATENNDSSGNVFIGYFAGYYETGKNKLYIVNSESSTPLIHGDFNWNKVAIIDILVLPPRSSFPASPVEGKLFVSNTLISIAFLGVRWKQ